MRQTLYSAAGDDEVPHTYMWEGKAIQLHNRLPTSSLSGQDPAIFDHFCNIVNIRVEYPCAPVYKVSTNQSCLESAPPGPASPKNITMFPDVDNIDSAPAMQIFLINSTALLRWLASNSLKAAQQRYKLDHNKKVRVKPIYAPDGYVFVDRPLMPSYGTEQWVSERYLRRMSNSHGQ